MDKIEISKLQAEINQLRAEVTRLTAKVCGSGGVVHYDREKEEERQKAKEDESTARMLEAQLDKEIKRIDLSTTKLFWEGVAIVPKGSWEAYWRHQKREGRCVEKDRSLPPRPFYKNLEVITVEGVYEPKVFRV